MNKTQAIGEASKHCSIWGRGNNWTVCGPWNSEKPNGPCTEVRCDSYRKALLIRSAWRARVALALMGRYTDDARFEIEHAAFGMSYGGETTARGLLNRALNAE